MENTALDVENIDKEQSPPQSGWKNYWIRLRDGLTLFGGTENIIHETENSARAAAFIWLSLNPDTDWEYIGAFEVAA